MGTWLRHMESHGTDKAHARYQVSKGRRHAGYCLKRKLRHSSCRRTLFMCSWFCDSSKTDQHSMAADVS